jgi:hypothetical protein
MASRPNRRRKGFHLPRLHRPEREKEFYRIRAGRNWSVSPWRALARIIVLLAAFVEAGYAAETTIHGRITYEVQEGVYVDMGRDAGLEPGLPGSLQLDDGRVFAFEVLHAARQSALLHLPAYPKTESLREQAVALTFEPRTPPRSEAAPVGQPPVAEKAPEAAPPPETPKTEAFVPLLAPVKTAPVAAVGRNLSHGRIQVYQMFQRDSQGDLGYSVTRLSSFGGTERIEGSAWSFEWSGDLQYRTGDAYLSHPDYQEPHLDLYRAMLQRPLGEDGFLRFGRFVPFELPAIGYVDGLQGQVRPGEHTRIGVVGGLKPNRIDLDASADEPFVVPYAMFTAGPRDGRHYFGTVGLLNSYYQGEIDRLALLFDQRAGLAKGLTLYSTAVVDFDVGASQTRSGTRLTQLDVSAVSELSSFLTLRAGVDHWERPDQQAERALVPFQDERFFDNGYWRYWVGSSQNIPWNLRLAEEVGFIESDTVDGDVRWQVSATRSGLGGWQDASVTVAVYNLIAYENHGYGCRVSGYLPLNKGTVIVQPAAGFRVLQAAPAQDISLSYLSVGLDGRLGRNWNLFGGVTYFSGDGVGSTLFELGLGFAW